MHFSFLPFWLMKSRLWLGALCFKHRLTSRSLFLPDTIQRSSSTTFFIWIPALRSADLKLCFIFFLNSAQSFRNRTAGNRLCRGRLHFDTELCRSSLQITITIRLLISNSCKDYWGGCHRLKTRFIEKPSSLQMNSLLLSKRSDVSF